MKHPYAEILHAIADGKRVQWHTSNGRWDEQEHIITLEEVATEDFSPMSYRIHPDDVEPVAEDSSVAGALAEAEAAFRRYAEHHATKGAEQKAAENAALACKMAAALALWKPESAVDQDLLFSWLAHGDAEHREWLRNAIAAFFAGGKWPDPTGMSALEAERAARQAAQLADLQELQAKSGLAHRKAVQEAVDEAVKATREACAKECESRHANGNRKYTHADECAAGIRTMG